MRDNNFDTMRLVAALCVLISHSFPLSYGATAVQPLFLLSNGQTTLGTVSVYVFFCFKWLSNNRQFRTTTAPPICLSQRTSPNPWPGCCSLHSNIRRWPHS